MERLQLFRVKVFPTLGNQHVNRGELLHERVANCPSAELRKGYVWHIGNVETVDESTIYFRFGRTTKTTVERFKDGRFVDAEIETAPSTTVLLDWRRELCAIAGRAKLAPTTPGIASTLQRLLNEGEPRVEFPVEFEIGSLKNPDGLIESLLRAYQVQSFWLTVTRDNLFDVQKHFIKPTEETVKELRADKGKAVFTGSDIDGETAAALTRSVSASGDEAGATLRYVEGGPKVRVALKKEAVVLTADNLETLQERARVANEMRARYREIRGTVE